MNEQFKQFDPKEVEFADTIFIHDIETRVFQAIVVKCLSYIEGIGLLEGTLFDNLLGREGNERIKGIHVEQDQKNHSVGIKVELNITHGISIPEKAEEIQSRIVEEVSRLTGLHVSCVHVIFKSLIAEKLFEEVKVEIEEKDETYSTQEF